MVVLDTGGLAGALRGGVAKALAAAGDRGEVEGAADVEVADELAVAGGAVEAFAPTGKPVAVEGAVALPAASELAVVEGVVDAAVADALLMAEGVVDAVFDEVVELAMPPRAVDGGGDVCVAEVVGAAVAPDLADKELIDVAPESDDGTGRRAAGAALEVRGTEVEAAELAEVDVDV